MDFLDFVIGPRGTMGVPESDDPRPGSQGPV
jgi:hypothetical protein